MIDEAGAAQHLLPESRRRKTITSKEIEAVVAKIARIPPKSVSKDDAEVLKDLDALAEARGLRAGQGDRGAGVGDQAAAGPGLREPEKPIGNYLFTGPTGVGKTEVAKRLARAARGRAPALRHVGVHGEAHRQPADRRAAGLCRLRPGRAPDRRRRPASALRAAPRRDGEGAPGRLQHPAAGDGQRQAHRPQRPDGRLPQRRADHDLERRARRSRPRRRSASGGRGARARTRPRSSGCSRRSSATGSTR